VTDKRGELRICDVIRSSQSLHSIASCYHSFGDDVSVMNGKRTAREAVGIEEGVLVMVTDGK